jgi:hypothetical protein
MGEASWRGRRTRVEGSRRRTSDAAGVSPQYYNTRCDFGNVLVRIRQAHLARSEWARAYPQRQSSHTGTHRLPASIQPPRASSRRRRVDYAGAEDLRTEILCLLRA